MDLFLRPEKGLVEKDLMAEDADALRIFGRQGKMGKDG